jgi:drug/metabolite transporter (DMT)-like permease
MKTAVVLVLAILSQAAGNVVLSRGMRAVPSTSTEAGAALLESVIRTIENPAVWAGTALLLVFFVLYSAALSWADLSFVLPATAFGYVVNVACGHFFLSETVTPARWAGSVVITLGVVLVSRSGVRDNPPDKHDHSTRQEGPS